MEFTKDTIGNTSIFIISFPSVQKSKQPKRDNIFGTNFDIVFSHKGIPDIQNLFSGLALPANFTSNNNISALTFITIYSISALTFFWIVL